MLYLPKKLGMWYMAKAQERGFDQGEVMYFALRVFASQNGFECNHPSAEHVLHQKGNKLYRCNLCGFLFYKKSIKKIENGEIVEKVEITPRIEVL